MREPSRSAGLTSGHRRHLLVGGKRTVASIELSAYSTLAQR